MNSHRFSHHMISVPPLTPSTGAFVALPVAPQASSAQAALYQAAYQAAMQSSREKAFREYLDRTLFTVMN